MEEGVVEELFRHWLLHGQSGCHFASHAASKAKFVFSTSTEDFDEKDLDAAADVVDGAAESNRVAILMFPWVASISELARVIARFEHRPRWRTSEVRFSDPKVDIVGINIEFQTMKGDISAAMGFAPCLEMPMTRRAPCDALALWGGEKSNPFFPWGAAGTVNMADAAHQLDGRAAYDRVWDNTVVATKERLAIPPFDAIWLRKVSFCLPREQTDAIFTRPAQNTARSPSEGST